MIIRFSKSTSDQITTLEEVHVCMPIFDKFQVLKGFNLVLEKKDGNLGELILQKDVDFDLDQFEIAKDDNVPCLFQMTLALEEAGLNPGDFNSEEDFCFAYGKAIGWKQKTHEEVLEILKWASESDKIALGNICDFVISKQWTRLTEARDNNYNLSFDPTTSL